MKKIIFLLITICISVSSYCQQCKTDSKSCSDVDTSKPKRIGLIGSGNLNTEAFEKANASGKLGVYVRLIDKEIKDSSKTAKKEVYKNLTLYLSFNKNIAKSDSFYSPSILFPDLGNNAFDATLEYSCGIEERKNIGHYIIPFAEYWIKDFKIGKSDSSFKKFVTVNTTAGLRYVFHQKWEKEQEKENNAFFSAALYFTHNQVLKKDESDFQESVKINSPAKMPLSYNAIGFKLAVEYNNFQVYVDMRNVLGSESKIPDRNIRGFSYNIGFVTTADIF